MKSSTLRRSNLSKQRMRVLEELSKEETMKKLAVASTEEYVKPMKDKEKELDVLWQNFRINQKEEKSPGIYLATGFIAGAVTMLILMTLLSFSVNSNKNQDFTAQDKPQYEKAKLTFIPADKKGGDEVEVVTTEVVPETYTVKSGDTLAGIIIRFYGKYDISKIEKIKQANNMRSADSISIGQKLIIPMD